MDFPGFFYLLWNNDLFSNFYNSTSLGWQTETLMELCSSKTARKMCFPSRGCSCVSRPKQSIDSSFLHRHMVFCVILGWGSREEWGMVVVVSVNVCVSGCLECLESNITRPWTFNTTLHKPHTILRWLTQYDWSVTKFPVLSGLEWTPELSVWISEEGKKGGVNISVYH